MSTEAPVVLLVLLGPALLGNETRTCPCVPCGAEKTASTACAPKPAQVWAGDAEVPAASIALPRAYARSKKLKPAPP